MTLQIQLKQVSKIDIKKLWTICLSIVQLVLVAAIIVIDKLTVYKALVMRHVYSRKLYYMQYIDSSFSMVIILCIVLLSIYLVYKYRKKATVLMFIGILISFAFNLSYFKGLMTYPYMLFVLLICWLVEMIKLMIKK